MPDKSEKKRSEASKQPGKNEATTESEYTSPDEVMGAFTQAVHRFTLVLPEIPRDPARKISLATEGPRLNRLLKLLLQETPKEELLREHLPLLSKAVGRLNSLIDTLETDSLLGIADIPPLDDLYIFSRLREKPKEDVVSLFNLVVAEPSSLGASDRMALHYALVELGVPVGLGIGPVGWIKLILIIFLVLLLIISLFKPELLPAIKALAQVLATIDGAGAAPKLAPQGGGTAPPPPPPPPLSGTAAQLELIRDKNARLKEMLETLKGLKEAGLKAAAETLGGAILELTTKIDSEVRALDVPSHKIATVTKELIGCEWFELYDPGPGGYHDLEYTGKVGENNPDLEIKQDGTVTKVTPPRTIRLPGGKKTSLHLVGDRTVRRNVVIEEYSK